MNYQQQFEIKQCYHKIKFFAFDIVNIERYEVGMENANYVAECMGKCSIIAQPYGFGMPISSDKCQPILQKHPECIRCQELHFNEVYIDGFCIDVNDYNWNERPYIATLQTGIRVPVTNEIYDAWKQGWENKAVSSKVKSIIIFSDNYIE